jgi:YggT family protein
LLELLGPILHVLLIILDVAQLLVIASIVISWINVDPSNQLVMLVNGITEPVYRYFRKWTRNIPGPIDWAPMIVILIIILAQSYVRLGITKI